MWVRFGTAAYGRVDAWAGEHAETTFLHTLGVPLFPLGSRWVGIRARPETAANVRSIAATYARWYGPVVAAVALAQLPLAVAVPIAVLAVAGVAWSVRAGTLHGDRARRRSDFDLLAFGTRCDPRRWSASGRAEVRGRAASLWERSQPLGARTPADVARLGARSAREAVLAYACVRLSGDVAAADRIALGVRDEAVAGDPYRVADAGPSTEVQDEIAAAVRVGAIDLVGAPPDTDDDHDDDGDGDGDGDEPDEPDAEQARAAEVQARRQRAWATYADTLRAKWTRDARRAAAAAVLLAVVPVVLGVVAVRGGFTHAYREVDLARLEGVDRGDRIFVRCERVESRGIVHVDAHSTALLLACEQHGRVLAALGNPDRPVPRVVAGQVCDVTPEQTWLGQMPASPKPLAMYLAPPLNQRLIAGGIALLALLGAVWLAFMRVKLRRRAAALPTT